ncbi:MAG: hypothetical protein FD127_596 [Acidimicrobiaceae bacterium]|jgi:hypothetical protein|nr:MAG: hypothetical protein FD127_596 [Acidimicrobiaceae bacterium]
MYDSGMESAALGEIVSVDDLIDAVALIDRLRAAVAMAAARLAEAGSWAADGHVSMISWLQHRCRMSHADAARLLHDGRFLERYEAVGAAAVSGRVSASHVGAMRNAVTTPTANLFDEHHGAVVDAIAELDLIDTALVCRQWRQQAEAVVDMPEPKVPERSWKSSTLDDGTIVGRFVFDPATAEQLEHAIATAHMWEGADDQRSSGRRNADAVFDIVTFFNANHLGEGTPRHRPHVELTIDAHSLLGPTDAADAANVANAITGTYRPLPGWVTDTLSCDCVIHRVLRSGSAVLGYGRATRTVTRDLFRAVANRDGGCRFPDCTRKIAWCDAHHIRWWRNHGETSLDNLMLLCSRHHHHVHQHGWQIVLQADASISFTTADGRHLVSRPRGQPRIRPPIAA